MFGSLDAIEMDGVIAFPAGSGDLAYFYLPTEVDSQRGSDGAPIANLISAGSGGFLQISALWDASAEALDALRRELVERHEVEDVGQIRLTFASIRAASARLLLGDGQGSTQTLATSRTSGMPPYSAVFNVTLTPQQHAGVAAAFNGRRGFLAVTYEATLPMPVNASARVAGDLSDIAAMLGAGADALDAAAISRVLEAAIADGRLVLDLVAPPEVPGLAERLRQKVLRTAVEVLRAAAGSDNPDLAVFEVVAEITETFDLPLSLSSDISTWFDGHGTVTPVPGPGPTEPPGPDRPDGRKVTVALGFEASEAPIALVRITSAAEEAAIAPPDFAPVEVVRGASVMVRTSYLTGGEEFACEVPAPPEGALKLDPADLGLIDIRIDAQPLLETGVSKARATLRYRPRQTGLPDDCMLQFRGNTWHAVWFVVSRGEPFNDTLEYDLVSTTSDGRAVKQIAIVATSPAISLTPSQI